ncbi:MAG: RNA methyltransferase [Leptospira sp.]|nr:RNA methyltransferase [Leptospira sp.]
MNHLTIINDPTDPRVGDYSLLKQKEIIREHFIADHEKTVIRMLESDIEVISLFCVEKYLDKHRSIIEDKLPVNVPIYSASEQVFQNTVGYAVHRGFLAIGRIPPDWNFPGRSPMIIATNEIADAENMGSIIRTATAFGIEQLITDSYSCSPFLRRSVRVSMGNIFYTKIRRSSQLADDLKQLKSEGYKVIGLSLPLSDRLHQTTTLDKFPFPDKSLIVLGNEANGLHENIQEVCDRFLTIPMNPLVDSLNVSHSLAVVLGQSWIQRRLE